MTPSISPGTLFQSLTSLDLFDAADCRRLATQMWVGRYGRVLALQSETSTARIQLLDDGYEGFVPAHNLEINARDRLQIRLVTSLPNSTQLLTPNDIRDRLPAILSYAETAAQQPNHYLWGGTIGPNFDCSGIVQRSFASQDIRVPRDSYQQADFCEPLLNRVPRPDELAHLRAGDLIFFQFGHRVDHVAIYWGDGRYLHSSGPENGRNGFGWDYVVPELAESTADDPIGTQYRQRICRIGRVTSSLPFPAIAALAA
ncbi:MAG: C40 family peptidase [Cyanobacteria bacterium J06642_2]